MSWVQRRTRFGVRRGSRNSNTVATLGGNVVLFRDAIRLDIDSLSKASMLTSYNFYYNYIHKIASHFKADRAENSLDLRGSITFVKRQECPRH